MENLTSYLKRNGISQAKFAEAIGITQSALSRMCADLMAPSLDTALRIEAETQGAIPVQYWEDVLKLLKSKAS